MVQKCLHCGASKKTNRAFTHELEGSHFDLLTSRDRFSCRGPGTGTNYEKRVNGTRNSVRKSQPEKRARLFRFSPLSGNFPVGRTDETCSIYHRTGNSGNFDLKEAPFISWGNQWLRRQMSAVFSGYRLS